MIAYEAAGFEDDMGELWASFVRGPQENHENYHLECITRSAPGGRYAVAGNQSWYASQVFSLRLVRLAQLT